jgi:hypothetical protein
LGERLNGIQEVRGSIPLASMAGPLLAFVVALMSRRRHGLDRVRAFFARLFVLQRSVRLPRLFAGIAQLVEHNLAKVGVAGSSPVSRFRTDDSLGG